MKSNESLQKRIAALEKRNKRVEADKAWETSWLRPDRHYDTDLSNNRGLSTVCGPY
ncbi:MAG: hypothetical protein ABI220_03455 [Candidatus Saccharimonadales bacterium]